MYIHEFGSGALPKIILLHPMGITGAELYQIFSPYFQGDYCIIAPDQGGHGKAGHYVSLQDEVLTLEQYLISRNYKDIKLLYGASMGAAAACELLKNNALHIEKIWLDGGAFAANAPLANCVVKAMLHAIAKKLGQNSGLALKILAKSYGERFAEIMKQNFLKLNDSDIDRICDVCSHRELRSLTLARPQALHLDWGQFDSNRKLSQKAVSTYFPHAEITIRSGYIHCGYMAFRTKEYVEELERFMRQ